MKRIIIVVLIALFVLSGCSGGKKKIYNEALSLAEQNKYDEAIEQLQQLENYKDSAEKITEIRLAKVNSIISKGQYKDLTSFINTLYSNEADLNDAKAICDALYTASIEHYDNKEYQIAKNILDSVIKTSITDKSAFEELKKEVNYDFANHEIENENYENAIQLLDEIADFKDSQDKRNDAKYGYVLQHQDYQDEKTYLFLKQLKSANYKDSAALFDSVFALKIRLLVNYDSGDLTSGIDVIKKHDNGPWIHCLVEGREPGKTYSVRVVCKLYWGNREENSSTMDYTIDRNTSGFAFPMGVSYYTYVTHKIWVYDEDSNLLASKQLGYSE